MITRLLTAFLLAAAAALPTQAAAGPAVSTDRAWPVYGHDLANTRTTPEDGPQRDKVSADLPKAWEFASETGDFTGTPVIADGVLVAGDHGGHVYALDAVTGKVLWSRKAGDSINGSAAIDLDAPGGPTVFVPVADLGAPRLLALSLVDGSVRWDTVLTNQEGAYVYGSPVFWNGMVYIGTCGPNNDDATARGSMVALDERTGDFRWHTFTVPPGADGAAIWSTPAIDPQTGRLYIDTGNNYHEPATETSDAILAFDARNGALVDGFQATPDDVWGPDNLTRGPDHDFGASPNLFEAPDGRKLVGAGQKSGIYWALDRASLDPVWNTSVGPGGYLGGIMGSTAFDGTRIYGSDALDGAVFALERDGAQTWRSQDTAGAHFGPATVARGVLYNVDPSGSLMARDTETGEVLAQLPLGGAAFGGVSASGDAVYVAVGTGPPPEPAPQRKSTGSIIAFGDTSKSGGDHGRRGGPGPGPRPGPARRARIKLTVAPNHVRAGRRVVLRFRARRGATRRTVRGATIRVAGRKVHTGKRGRARLKIRFRRPGLYRARATKSGMRFGRDRIRVLRTKR